MALLIVGSAEVLVILGYAVVLVTQGPRGIVAHFEHIAFSGHWFAKTPEGSSRIFWTSTGQILAAEAAGIFVIFGVWKIRKRFTSAT